VASLASGEAEPISANEEVATKLDLAKAYEEMGDMEGARELLQEVVKEGNADQQATARSILERIG
jgi:pilus assembly protein FimV